MKYLLSLMLLMAFAGTCVADMDCSPGEGRSTISVPEGWNVDGRWMLRDCSIRFSQPCQGNNCPEQFTSRLQHAAGLDHPGELPGKLHAPGFQPGR